MRSDVAKRVAHKNNRSRATRTAALSRCIEESDWEDLERCDVNHLCGPSALRSKRFAIQASPMPKHGVPNLCHGHCVLIIIFLRRVEPFDGGRQRL